MGAFLREHWLWIVGPIMVLLLLFAIIVLTGDALDTSPFQYSDF